MHESMPGSCEELGWRRSLHTALAGVVFVHFPYGSLIPTVSYTPVVGDHVSRIGNKTSTMHLHSGSPAPGRHWEVCSREGCCSRHGPGPLQ